MKKIAVIQFPGNNCEIETVRACVSAGLDATIVRWNSGENLEKFDGFILPGGFAYEDRGRAGLIASLDPIMNSLKTEAEKGKPVLGICNGAQALVEAGMVPGGSNYELGLALARNKRIKDGKVLGTGFYNTWVFIKSVAPQGRSPFNHLINEGEIFRVPVAHGEGRFVSAFDGLFGQLEVNQQILFKYCDADGNILEDFPVNPNGAARNSVAICNPAGNVMAIMPHPERGFWPPMGEIFASMRASLEEVPKMNITAHIDLPSRNVFPTETYNRPPDTVELLIDLIITDNEAFTLESTLQRLGFTHVRLRRQTHYEVGYADCPDTEDLFTKLAMSGELLNTNKERLESGEPCLSAGRRRAEGFQLLVRDIQDFVGLSKFSTLRERLGFSEVTCVKKGTVWTVSGVTDSEFRAIMQTNIFYNFHSQTCLFYNS